VRLSTFTLDTLTLITVAQVGICAVLILSAPAIVEALNLQFRQIAILRFGGLGAVFQFIFIASTSMLLFFDRRRLYLGLQMLFFTLNLLLTGATIELSEDYYGIGYFLACLISSFVAFVLADRTFAHLNFLTFIGNNPTIRQSTAAKINSQWGLFRLLARRS
jgi:polysaccharide biosynthesis protein PelG